MQRPRGWIALLLAAPVVAGCGGSIDAAGDDAGPNGAPPDGSRNASPNDAAVDAEVCTASILACEPTLASFGPCWTCAKQACMTQLSSCAADGICNSAIAGALSCVDAGGDTEQCFEFAFNSANDPALSAAEGCLMVSYSGCGCAAAPAPPPAAPPDAAADLPLCSCMTTPPYSNAVCMQTPACQVPSCPVSGAPCCTPAGLCGCASAIPGGPDLTCN